MSEPTKTTEKKPYSSAGQGARGRGAAPKKPGDRDQKGGGRGGRGRGDRREREPQEFEQKILELARVTRVTSGGKRMSFRCTLVIGDRKGRVGLGVAKGGDVQLAIAKAFHQAKKNVIRVPLVDETIPHPVWVKSGSAMIMLKPAPKGTGLKSGGAVRMVLEFAGVPNAVSKIVNSKNKINIARATFEAIAQLRAPEQSVDAKASTPAAEEIKPVASQAKN